MCVCACVRKTAVCMYNMALWPLLHDIKLKLKFTLWSIFLWWCQRHHVTQKQICHRRAMLAIHNVFCWWIKVEEAKYLAKIYDKSLTLRTNHPLAKSLSLVSSTENREREREQVRERKLWRGREWRGGREQGRRECELCLWATLCIGGREKRHTGGREGGKHRGREGGCLCIAANCTGSPTLCCSCGSKPPA